jgi:sucrose-phosphate phosphatase-like hydrolase, Archaeal
MQTNLIFIDLDGTITDEEGRLPFESIEAIYKLKKMDFKICITSANSYCIVRTLRRYFAITDYIIAENGGVIDYDGNMMILTDRKNVLRAVNVIKAKFPELKESWTNSMRLTDFAFMRPKDREIIDRLKKFVEENKLGVKIYDSGYSLQVINTDMDKIVGISKILDLTKIPKENTFGVGDSENDLEMLKFVNFPVALNNSIDEIKRIAKLVTKGSFYKGFLEFVDYLEKIYYKS